jgi:hypothetical protein
MAFLRTKVSGAANFYLIHSGKSNAAVHHGSNLVPRADPDYDRRFDCSRDADFQAVIACE